jgi:CubicO group peptidase (beta-lactamase class C family)
LILAGLLFPSCQAELPRQASIAPPFESASPASAQIQTRFLLRVDSLIAAYVSEDKVPGLEYMILKGGKLVHHQAIGWANPQSEESLEKNRLYRLASMTKPITAVAVLQLMDQGKLSLDDPISAYLPSFQAPEVLASFDPSDSSYTTVPAHREISIRDLLTHTSGIGYLFIQPEYGAIAAPAGVIDGLTLDSVSLAEVIPTIGKLPLLHQPGEKWTYGLSLDVLGYLVEVVSGESLDHYFRTHLFEPLGMNDTGFYFPETDKDRFVPIFGLVEGSGLFPIGQLDSSRSDMERYPYEGAKTYQSGGAGLSGTAENYARFAQMLTNGGALGDVRILKEETARLMGGNNFTEENPYGLGVSIKEPLPGAMHPDLPGAFGWGGIFNTRYFSDPSMELTVVFMSQSLPNDQIGSLYNASTRLIYQSLSSPTESSPVIN